MNLFEKALEELLLHFPGKKIYFIYSHKNGKDRFRQGLNANTEISHFCQSALKRCFGRVIFLRMENEKPRRIASINSKDVVIGHIGQTFAKASQKTKKMIAFYPWAGHEDRSTANLFNCISLEQELEYWKQARSIILLTSEYNKREYIDSPRNFWHPIIKKTKVRVVHQPVDLKLFKRIKWEYTTNDFLYIGNNAHMKCLDSSKRLVKGVARNLHIYGAEGNKLNHLDASQVSKLPALADFFIQPGMWEGQSVAILEASARGFIPIVSPETGYPYFHPFLLRYGDDPYNLNVLKKLLNTPSQERKELGNMLYQQLSEDVNHNDWQQLTNVLIEEVAELLND